MNYITGNRYGRFSGSISYYLKVIFNKTFYTILILLSIFMLIKQNSAVIYNIRSGVIDIAKPQLTIIKFVDTIINKFGYAIRFFSNIKAENIAITKENLNLKIKLLKLNILEDENIELKNILNFVSRNSIFDYTVKKINILNRGDFINKAIINTNNDDKIRENDLVIDSQGNLIGRIINLKNNWAEILLLMDPKSKLPAKLSSSKIKVLLKGNESKNLKIEFFLGEKFNLKEGETVVTSNDGLILQNGVSIGKVTKNKNGEFFVKMDANLGNIDYVIILHNKTLYKE